MQLTTLRRLFIDELQELYLAETLIEDALPRMEKNCSGEKLRRAIHDHHNQTRVHLERLDKVCALVEVSPRGGHGHAVKSMIGLIEDQLGTGGEPEFVDAFLMASARRIEHLEIASYSTAQVYATALDMPKVAELLGETLNEEQQTDELLLELAQSVREKEKQGAH